MDIPANIRRRRLAHSLSLEALAVRAGVSRAMLSDIERGSKNPTVKLLCNIAAALDCTVSDLLGEATPAALAPISLVRAGDRQRLIDPQSGIERHLLAPAFVARGLEVIWYTIPPHTESDVFPPHPPGTAEHLTLVTGTLVCRLGAQAIALAPGDSLSFQADVPHAFANPGTEPCAYFLLIDSRRA